VRPPRGIRPGGEEDLRLDALAVHSRGAVAGGGHRILDQNRDLVGRRGRDRLHHDVPLVPPDARHRSDLVEGQTGGQERSLS
jgi:hypothetical protein